MRDVVVRKRSLDRDFICSAYSILEPNYKLSLEGCNEYAEGIIRNAKGDKVATLKPGESVEIARPGDYLVCIEGRNALGSIVAEWVPVPVTNNKEYCCDELRATNDAIRTDLNEVKAIVDVLNLGTVTVSAGDNTIIVKNGNDYQVSAIDTKPDVTKAYVDQQIANVQDKDTITTVSAGANTIVVKNGDDYQVSAIDTKPDVTKAYVDQQIANIKDKDTITTVSAGDNTIVVKNGNDYQISSIDTKPDVTKAYVDQQIANIQDKDTIITVSAGDNTIVVKNGNNYQVSAIDTKPDVTKAYVDQQIASIQDKDTITTVSAGDNVTVTKNENNYKVSSNLVLRNDITSYTNIGNIRYGQVITKGTSVIDILKMMLKEAPSGYEPLNVIHIKQTSSPQRPYFDTGMVFKPGKQVIETYGGVEPGEMGSFLTAVESTSMRGGFHLYGESNRVQFYWGNINRGLNALPIEQVDFTKLNKFTMGCVANNTVEFSVGSYNDTFTFNSQYIDYTSTATWKVFSYSINTEIKWGFVANTFFIREDGIEHKFEFLRRKSDGMIVLYDHFNSREIEPIGDASLLEEYLIP